mgnify:CR=1 FL=1
MTTQKENQVTLEALKDTLDAAAGCILAVPLMLYLRFFPKSVEQFLESRKKRAGKKNESH